VDRRQVIGPKVYKSPPPEQVPRPTERVPIPKEPRRVTIRPKVEPSQPPAAQSVQASSGPLPPEVLAARRLAERPVPKDTSGPTIFGEDLISEKSLDEVILGYLAGDGEDSG